MKTEVPFRVIVSQPLAGVWMKVQRGKNELLDPATSDPDRLVFEFPVRVDLSGSEPNFLGPYAHGPKDARFIYVNSGTYAGEHLSRWGRRAKLSLMSIGMSEVEAVLKSGKSFETTIDGIGRDGGPVCASVKGLVWKAAK